MFIKAGVSLFFAFSLFILAVDPAFGVDFTISNLLITEEDEIEVDASISGLTSSSCSSDGCYLQGRLKKVGGSYYFGYLQNNSGEWVDYISSPDVDYIKSKFFSFKPVSGSWLGKLKVKNNPQAAVYEGPSDYLVDFRRFSGNVASSSSGSNSLTVHLTTSTPTPIPTPTATATPTVTLTSTTTPTATALPTATPVKTVAPTVKPVLKTTVPTSESQVLAARKELEVTPSSTGTPISKSENGRKLPVGAVAAMIAGAGFIGVATLPFIRMRLKGYNEKHASGKSEEVGRLH